MSTASPTAGNIASGNDKSRAGQLRRPPMIGGMLLVAAATLYFWFTGGRSMGADVDAIRRIAGCGRAAVLAAFTAAEAGAPPQSTAEPCAKRAETERSS